ncbi:MAG: hypothetical protein KatS3mg068_0351 [Candidatus Sericytochromatia bacterium]|nr:MAG: hypothetical protein KatS3mg068_0351 [Candidatus Sericytochromatia bacterium]
MLEEKNKVIWENIFSTREWGKYPSLHVVRVIAKNFYDVEDRTKIKILEVGAGAGANIWYLAREGFSISAIEFSKSAIKKIQERFKQENLTDRIEMLLEGDYYEKLDSFRNNYFDCIIDVESIICNSYERSKSIINKIYNKLKKGGIFISLHFGKNSWGDYSKNRELIEVYEGPISKTGFVRFLDEKDINDLYSNNKMKYEFIHLDEYFYDINDKIKCLREYIVCLRKLID